MGHSRQIQAQSLKCRPHCRLLLVEESYRRRVHSFDLSPYYAAVQVVVRNHPSTMLSAGLPRVQGAVDGQHKSWLSCKNGKRQRILDPDLPQPLHLDNSDVSGFHASAAHGTAAQGRSIYEATEVRLALDPLGGRRNKQECMHSKRDSTVM